MSNNKIHIVILGATGMVGQRLAALLHGHPRFEVVGLGASVRSAGKSYSQAARWRVSGVPYGGLGEMPVRACDPGEFRGPPGLVLSALPGETARDAEPAFARAGWGVVSNASAHRMSPDVPLVVPEVNPDHLELLERQPGPGFLVTNPNCVAIPLVLSLKPLHDAVGVDAVSVATYQAVSGAGFDGESAWEMLGSVHPHPGDEEEKVEAEPRRILGTVTGNGLRDADIAVSARCVRVPVRDGHMLAVSVRTRTPVTPEDARHIFETWRPAAAAALPSAPEAPLRVVEGRDRPSPVFDADAGEGMAVSLGRIERCAVLGLKYYVLGHNTLRGAAGAALLNAELLTAEPWASRRRDPAAREPAAAG